ncbi:NADAR family protein [Tessaracoccus massiliensis]|uniref:NADAR family protein n=1 Tax=Tessaracoccus massiliensis TaxID=1522311 RepID=UPI00058CB641|nr:NADAR family protein [Tessaracoccus massiliensis]
MVVEARSVEQLRAAVAAGHRPDVLFFWGHRPDMQGQVDRCCLSENYVAPFEADGERFPTVEHYIAWRKATLFGDGHAAERILQAEAPNKAKAIGRSVKPFHDDQWQPRRLEIAVAGNVAKFAAHPALAEYLLQTGTRVLAEASPIDRVWGIGLAADHAHAKAPERWPGLNIMGFALMEARARLAS